MKSNDRLPVSPARHRAWRGPVEIRAIRPDDAAALQRFYRGLSPDSRRTRFFCVNASVSEAAGMAFCTTDHRHREGFVAVSRNAVGRERIVGHLCLEADPDRPAAAEVAVAVADAFQHRGIGRRLLSAAIAWGRREGLFRLTATTLVGNPAIQRLLLGCGLRSRSRYVDAGVAEITIDLGGPAAAAAA